MSWFGEVSITTQVDAKKEMSRSARLVATIATSWGRIVLSMIIGLVASPMLLRYLGEERFGTAKVVEQYFAYIEFLTFGLGGAILILVLKAETSGTAETVLGTARAGFRLLSKQLIWLCPASIALIIAFPVIFRLPSNLWSEFYWAAPGIIFGIILAPTSVFRMILVARQQGYIVDFSLTVQTAVAAGVGLGFAAAGFGLTGQIWATLIALLAFVMINAHFTGVLTRSFWANNTVTVNKTDVWNLQWPLLVIGIGTQVNSMSDGMIVGLVVGVGGVAKFFFTQRLLQLAAIFSGSLNGGGTWIGLVDLRAKVGVEAFRSRLLEVAKLNVGITALVLAPTLGLNQRFVELWVGKTFYAGHALTIVTYAYLVLFSWFCLFTALLDCFGQTRKRVWISTTGTLIKVVLTVPFMSWFDVAGLPLASIMGHLLTDAWYCPLVLCREHGVSLWALASGLLRALGLGSCWAVLCYFVGSRSEMVLSGWTGLVIEAGFLELISFCIAWFLLFSSSDRAMWTARVLRWTGRK